jgi:hypothetical protein
MPVFIAPAALVRGAAPWFGVVIRIMARMFVVGVRVDGFVTEMGMGSVSAHGMFVLSGASGLGRSGGAAGGSGVHAGAVGERRLYRGAEFRSWRRGGGAG